MSSNRFPKLSRRRALHLALAGIGAAPLGGGCITPSRRGMRVAHFSADVTVPLNHGMMGGSWLSTRVGDPLEAHGLVFLGDESPVVFVSVDWCEIRNDAYQRWQEVLGAAAGTAPGRVMISTVHQHDAPVADLSASRNRFLPNN